MSWLAALALAAVTVGGLRAALRNGGVVIDHVVLFSLGVAFYWLLPVCAGILRPFAGEPVLAGWYASWDAAEHSGAITGFMVFVLAAYGAFLAGTALGARLRLTEPQHATLPYDPRLLRLFLPPAAAIALLYAWTVRTQIGAGYTTAAQLVGGARGTLTATSLLLLSLCLLRSAETERWPRGTPGWRGIATDPFVVAYVATALLLVSLGGRLYVASALLMALVFRSVYVRPLGTARTVVIGIVATCAAGAIGSLRFGRLPTPLGIALNVLAEPLFTSYSLLHFLADGRIPWLAPAQFLLGDLLNIVPSVLLPGKRALLPSPIDAGYVLVSPLGALNSYVSFVINFGVIGSVVVMFCLGAALAVLRRRRSPLARVVYTMLAGWLPFTFFRDPFSISVVKNMLEFSVLLPTLIVWSSHVMTVIAPRHARAVPVDATS